MNCQLFHNFSLEKYKVGGIRAARESVHCMTSASWSPVAKDPRGEPRSSQQTSPPHFRESYKTQLINIHVATCSSFPTSAPASARILLYFDDARRLEFRGTQPRKSAKSFVVLCILRSLSSSIYTVARSTPDKLWQPSGRLSSISFRLELKCQIDKSQTEISTNSRSYC